MPKREFEKWKDGEIVTPSTRPRKSRWVHYGIDEVEVRPYSLMILGELEWHAPGDTVDDKHKHMEEIIGLGTGFKEYAGRAGGHTAKELLKGDMPITFNTVKRAQRWLHDNGKKLSPAAQRSVDTVTEVQHGRFLMEGAARLYRKIERPINEALQEAEKTPDPPYSRKIIADVLRKLMPQDTSDTLVPPPRMKSY